MHTLTPSDWLMLARLITAHLISEWLFQLSFWKTPKSGKKFIFILCSWFLQATTAGILTYVFAGLWTWSSTWLIGVIFIFRVVINVWEYKNKKIEATIFFIVKHFLYLLVNIICWIFLIEINLSTITDCLSLISSDARLWTVGLAYIILIWPVGSFIGRITEPWREELLQSHLKELEEIEKEPENKDHLLSKKDQQLFLKGLKKSGLWVGRLERILILTFVLINKYEAIGFLITAKIIRFTAMEGASDRKEAEYVLIGTMMSFVVALLVGIFANWLLTQIKP